MSNETPNLYNSKTAAEYLQKYGFEFNQHDMHMMRRYNSGPAFQKVGSSVIYTESALTSWALDQKCNDEDVA